MTTHLRVSDTLELTKALKAVTKEAAVMIYNSIPNNVPPNFPPMTHGCWKS
jgi:hypothetical protein